MQQIRGIAQAAKKQVAKTKSTFNSASGEKKKSVGGNDSR
jgi:hypothetical protein